MFYAKGQVVNILGIVGLKLSVKLSQLASVAQK